MLNEVAWNEYLTAQVERHGELGKALVRFWDYAKTLNAPVPAASPGEDNDYFHVWWDHIQHHLDVDIKAGGSWEWFYRNRETDELDGDEKSGNAGFEERMKSIVGVDDANQ